MDNLTIVLKIEQRLNKLSSNDYDNIDKWKIVESFNKALPDWCRRQLHGTNMHKTGDEQSKRRIDDLQVLLTSEKLILDKEDCYYGSSNWPLNYFEFKRVSLTAKTECCERSKFVAYLVEEANIDLLLRDELKKPNFEWGETLVTLMGNKVKIWTNNEFEIEEASLFYYKQPRRIEIQGVSNPYDNGSISQVDVLCEFKDDIVELLIDETVKIISGDIEYLSSIQIADKSVESNN